MQRLQLLKAGYSREEIASFEKLEQEEQSQDHAAEDQQQEQAAEPEKAAQPGKEIDIAGMIAAEVKKAIQTANINNAAVDALPKKTAEQALAEGVFGNPTK